MPAEPVLPPDKGAPHEFAVVWTTLPLISTVLPTIGHVGVSDSKGVIHDFSGPYTVTVDKMMCGPPRRVWMLDAARVGGGAAAFDAGVESAKRVYDHRMHNIFCDNCHSHVARTLNDMQYDGRTDWNMLRVWSAIWLKGRWVSTSAALRTIVPSAVLALIILLITVLPKVV